MVVEGYRQGKTGFPGVLESWHPDPPGSGPTITFILKADRKLQTFWRRGWPSIYPSATKRGPRVFISPDSDKWLYVRLF